MIGAKINMRRSLLIAVMALSAALSATAQTDAATRQKRAIQGSYLVDTSSFLNDPRVVYEYAKYMIQGDIFTEYQWSEPRKMWVKVYSVPYKLVYRSNADYMTGYNIVFNHPDGYVMRMCTGDINGDGKMDLWSSDSLFHTKEANKKSK